MNTVYHFNRKFWLHEEGQPPREIEHKDAVKMCQDGCAVYRKGYFPQELMETKNAAK